MTTTLCHIKHISPNPFLSYSHFHVAFHPRFNSLVSRFFHFFLTNLTIFFQALANFPLNFGTFGSFYKLKFSYKWHMWSQIPLVALEKSHKSLGAKDIMWDHVKMVIIFTCNLQLLFIQFTFNLMTSPFNIKICNDMFTWHVLLWLIL